jgi:hypothetical protein
LRDVLVISTLRHAFVTPDVSPESLIEKLVGYVGCAARAFGAEQHAARAGDPFLEKGVHRRLMARPTSSNILTTDLAFTETATRRGSHFAGHGGICPAFGMIRHAYRAYSDAHVLNDRRR